MSKEPRSGAVARTAAVCFGCFSIVNSMGVLRDPGFDANLWWVDLRVLPVRLGAAMLLVAGALIASQGLRPPPPGWRRRATVIACSVLALAGAANTLSFYRADIDAWMPFPLSSLLMLLFGWLAWRTTRPYGPTGGWRPRLLIALTVTCFVVGFPLMQILFFGTTSYARPADAIVVFGAKVNPDGLPSLSLRDRMLAAIAAYDEGLAPTLIVSGGVGATGYDEATVMHDIAVEAGVSESAIIVDSDGVDTRATVRDTVAIAQEHGLRTVLAVSHPYHLPRIKLAFEDTDLQVFTVPSKTTMVPQLPGIVAREVPAFWVYYLRALI